MGPKTPLVALPPQAQALAQHPLLVQLLGASGALEAVKTMVAASAKSASARGAAPPGLVRKMAAASAQAASAKRAASGFGMMTYTVGGQIPIQGYGAFDAAQHGTVRAVVMNAYSPVATEQNNLVPPAIVRIQFMQSLLLAAAKDDPTVYTSVSQDAVTALFAFMKQNAKFWDAMGTGDLKKIFAVGDEAAKAQQQAPPPPEVAKANVDSTFAAGKEIASSLQETLYLKVGIPMMLLLGGAAVVGVGLLLYMRSRRGHAATA
jgi:hypothetical protein